MSQEPLLNCTSKQGFNQISLHVLSSLVEVSGTSKLHWLCVKRPVIQEKFKPIIMFSHSTVRYSVQSCKLRHFRKMVCLHCQDHPWR